MKFYGVMLGIAALMLSAGCAKNDLDPLHLVSTKEVSVQKRQMEATGDEAGKAVGEEEVAADSAAVQEEVIKDL